LFDHYPKLQVEDQLSAKTQLDNQTNQMDNLVNQPGLMDNQVDNHVEKVVIQMHNQDSHVVIHPQFNEQYYLNLVAAKDFTIKVISEQLQNKDNQITTKDQQLLIRDQQINELIERDRESNHIIQSLQTKVNLQLQAPQQAQISKDTKHLLLIKC
jgi:hypothetical protein